MSDAAQASYSSVAVSGRLNEQPFTWTVPVVAGLAREQVMAEIRQRLVGELAPLLSDPTASISFGGLWAGPVDFVNNPPLGWRQTPVQESMTYTAPPSTITPPRDAPLPDDRPPSKSPGGELMQFLDAWCARHGLSSTERYYYLSLAQVTHAEKLIRMAPPKGVR